MELFERFLGSGAIWGKVMSDQIVARSRTVRDHCDHCVAHQKGLCRVLSERDKSGLLELEAARLPVRIFNPNDTIYAQGDFSNIVYTLISGWVELHYDMKDGRRHVTKIVLPGDVFGYEPLGTTRWQGATAITTSSICAMPTDKFEALRKCQSSFNDCFVNYLEDETKTGIESLTFQAEGTALERVSRFLLDTVIRLVHPKEVLCDHPYRAPLTQRLIAEAAGLTPIHVNRVLRRMRETHLVELRDGVITIFDLRELAKLAGLTLKSISQDSSTGRILQSPRNGLKDDTVVLQSKSPRREHPRIAADATALERKRVS